MARSIKKGPFVDDHLMKKVETEGPNSKKIIKNLVTPLYHHS